MLRITHANWREDSPIQLIQKMPAQACFSEVLDGELVVVEIGADLSCTLRLCTCVLKCVTYSRRRRSMNSGLNRSPVMYSGKNSERTPRNCYKIYLADVCQAEREQRRPESLGQDSLSKTRNPGNAGERRDFRLRIFASWSESLSTMQLLQQHS
jgi:hypothetical protein